MISLNANELLQEPFTLIVIKSGRIYKSSLRGITALMQLIKNNMLNGAYVADKVVGKSAALLFILGGVRQLYAETISEPALKVLEQNGVALTYGKTVPNILNRQGDGICPMEKKVLNIDDPQKAFDVLKNACKMIAG